MQEWKSSGAIVKAWVDGVPVEDEARRQVMMTAKLPVVRRVAVMPDVHVGVGCCIGTVIATRRALIPAAVGVDIGCGMIAVDLKTPRKAFDDAGPPERWLELLASAIPHGRSEDGKPGDVGAWPVGDVPSRVAHRWHQIDGEYEKAMKPHPDARAKSTVTQLGTLGTGNHFAELSEDDRGVAWLVIHSGSRGMGNRIGTSYVRLAKEVCRREGRALPDPDLAYLTDQDEEFEWYVRSMEIALEFARESRELMAEAVVRELSRLGLCSQSFEIIDCHHNYAAREEVDGEILWVTRKGAVSVGDAMLGVIPGSMGAKTFIVSGLGCEEAMRSCSHGAGRAGSRKWARSTFTVEEHAEATKGVACRKDEGVLDETPMAYKSIDEVMAAQADLVRVERTLKQFACLKG